MFSTALDSMPLHLTWGDILLRLIATALASGLIGMDREAGGHVAGFRTTVLVALAACITMLQANALLGLQGKPDASFVSMDILRFPLGVLTGVGFIGGGAILRRGSLVKGVTTAATLWLVTVIGLCFGGGQLMIGGLATLAALLILSPFKHVDRWLARKQKATVKIVSPPEAAIPDLAALLRDPACESRFVAVRTTEHGRQVVFELRWSTTDADGSARKIVRMIEQSYHVADFRMSKSEA